LPAEGSVLSASRGRCSQRLWTCLHMCDTEVSLSAVRGLPWVCAVVER
jgi:hypothetical protein